VTGRGPSPLPAMLLLRDRDALVVGSDEDAVRRVERLARAGARVRVLTREEPPEELRTLASVASVHIEVRPAREEDLDGAALAYVATSEEAQAPPLYARALRTGQLLCTIDRPELSTFINPAALELGPLTITVSTGGASPALSRRIREDLESLFDEPRFLAWLEELGERRAELPRGERAASGAEAVRGFAVKGHLSLPEPGAPGERADRGQK
jgi:precorrin-2 dehydrogenase / sirohydrochlorin ferrochelatase